VVMSFVACGDSKCEKPEKINLPVLDWSVYQDVKTLLPYCCHYANYGNDSTFLNSKVKITGWFAGSTYSGFMLSDDKRVTIDNNFKSDVTLEIGVGTDSLREQMRQFIDSVDVTQKCYVVGRPLCIETFNGQYYYSCPKYNPVFVVYDIKNISFGKEVENEE